MKCITERIVIIIDINVYVTCILNDDNDTFYEDGIKMRPSKNVPFVILDRRAHIT